MPRWTYKLQLVMLFDYEGGRMCVQVQSWQVSNACIGGEYTGITQLCMYGGFSWGFLVSNLWYWKCGSFSLKTTFTWVYTRWNKVFSNFLLEKWHIWWEKITFVRLIDSQNCNHGWKHIMQGQNCIVFQRCPCLIFNHGNIRAYFFEFFA